MGGESAFQIIDLGKSRYGGPLTTEQVKNVKTVFRILLVSLSLFVTFLSIQLRLNPILTSYSLSTCALYTLSLHGLFQEHFCILTWTLLYEFLFYPFLGERVPNSMNRIEIATFFCVVVNLVCLILGIVYFETGLTAIDTIILIAYRITQGLISQTIVVAIIEFTCAQSPYTMRGLLTAYISMVAIVSDSLAGLANSLFEITLHGEGIVHFIIPLCVKMLLCTVALLLHCVLHCVIALRYKRRVRGDGYFAQAIVEEVYGRYLAPRTN